MERKCGDCALKAIKNGMCPVFEADMEGQNGCPYFTTELQICELCGNIILSQSIIQEEDGVFHQICRNCVTGPPCKSCTKAKDCRLQNDQSCPEPLYVMVQHRQGNMVMQTQQLNPKRIQATCAQGCPCFWEEGLDDGNYCWKQLNCGCNNYKPNWRN